MEGGGGEAGHRKSIVFRPFPQAHEYYILALIEAENTRNRVVSPPPLFSPLSPAAAITVVIVKTKHPTPA